MGQLEESYYQLMSTIELAMCNTQQEMKQLIFNKVEKDIAINSTVVTKSVVPNINKQFIKEQNTRTAQTLRQVKR